METTKFSQTKLSKAEWNSIEIPLQSDQKEILQLIIDGFSNVHIKYNKTPSLLSYMKMENDASDSLHSHLFDTFFKETIEKQKKKYKIGDDFFAQSTSASSATSTATAVGGKKAMQFRIENTTKNLANEKDGIFEFVLIDIASKIFKYFADNNRRWNLHFYTLYHLTKNPTFPSSIPMSIAM